MITAESLPYDILFIIIVLIGFILILRRIIPWAKRRFGKKYVVEAVVADKRIHEMKAGYKATGVNATMYYITFDMENGKQKEFAVSKFEYQRLNKGERGTLHYQGTIYQVFKRNN